MRLPRIAGMDGSALSSIMLTWRLFIGGTLLVVLILSGIGVVMAWVSKTAEAKSDDVVAENVRAQPEVEAPTIQKCMECGVIESRRTIARYEEVVAPGAAIPAMVGGLNEVRRSSVSVSEITVRMNDGTSR